MLEQFAPGLPDDFEIDLRALAFERQAFFHRQQDFSNAEKADDGDQEIKAFEQGRESKRHSQLASDRIEPDSGQCKTEQHGCNGLGRWLFAHADKAAKRQQLHGEEFSRPELERKARDHGRQKRNEQNREHRPHE